MSLEFELFEGLYDLFVPVVAKTGSATGTADSGSTLTMVDSDLTGADDAWQFAVLLFTSGDNAGKSRVISNSVASTDLLKWRRELPHAVEAADGYTLSFGRMSGAVLYLGAPEAYGNDDFLAVGTTLEGSAVHGASGSTHPRFRDEPTVGMLCGIPLEHGIANLRDAADFLSQIKTVLQVNQMVSPGAVLGAMKRYTMDLASLRGQGTALWRVSEIEVAVGAWT
jgi:hypothetical protein